MNKMVRSSNLINLHELRCEEVLVEKDVAIGRPRLGHQFELLASAQTPKVEIALKSYSF